MTNSSKLPKISSNKLYYLAGPYTHHNKAVIAHRRLDHMHAEYWLLGQNIDVIQPINSSGALESVWKLPVEYEFWQKRDRKSIRYSNGVILILLPGWKESTGVTDEISYAKKLKKPVFYLKPVYDKSAGYIRTFKFTGEPEDDG